MLDKIVALATWVRPRAAVSDQLARNQRKQNTDASRAVSRVVRGGKAADVDSGSTWNEEWCRLFGVNHDKDVSREIRSLSQCRVVSRLRLQVAHIHVKGWYNVWMRRESSILPTHPIRSL